MFDKQYDRTAMCLLGPQHCTIPDIIILDLITDKKGNSHLLAGVLSFVPDGREYFWPPKETSNRIRHSSFICKIPRQTFKSLSDLFHYEG